MRDGSLRFLARRITTGEWLSRDLELTDVAIVRSLSGPSTIEATIDPELRFLMADDGLRVMEDWGTMIYAQRGTGRLRAHGIVLPPQEFEDDSTKLHCAGFTAYAHGSYYDGARDWGPSIDELDRPDPLQITQDLWEHLQSFPDSDLGVRVVGKLKSRVRIGTYEEPYRLRWWEQPDIGEAIDDLAETTPFDFVEEVEWGNEDQTEVDLRFRIGWPRLGKARDDLRFVLGENIVESIPVQSTELLANDVIGIGNGTGAKMVTARSTVRDGRLRRTVFYTDKTVRSADRMENRVQRIAAKLRAGRPEISEVVIRDHPNARIDQINLGDDVFIQTYVGGLGDVETWCRVLEIREGDDDTMATLSVEPSSRFTYSPALPGDDQDTLPAPTVVPEAPNVYTTVAFSSGESTGGTTRTTVALPAATQKGDLIMLGLLGGFSGLADCSDPRMTQIVSDTLSGRPLSAWYGYATEDGSGAPLAIALSGDTSAIGQFALAYVAVFRGDFRPLTPDLSRIALAPTTAGGSGTIPAIPGNGSGAIAMVFASSGIGGAYGFGWGEAPQYAFANEAGSYAVVSYATTHADPVVEQPAVVNDTGDSWRTLVVGLK